MSKAAGREGIPFRALVPNAVTALALCFGLTGVRFAVSAFEGNDAHWEIALACVIGAGVLDGMDGRIARLLRAQSRFGWPASTPRSTPTSSPTNPPAS